MKIAVISDLHGNCVALDATVEDMSTMATDAIVCLGDVVERGAQPKQVLNRIRNLACPVVMGNMDSFLLEIPGANEANANEGLLRVREWTLTQLDESDLSFIASFQPTCTLPLEGDTKLLCFHGSPRSYSDIILPNTDKDRVAEWLAPGEALMTGGHTHLQQYVPWVSRSSSTPAVLEWRTESHFPASARATFCDRWPNTRSSRRANRAYRSSSGGCHMIAS